MKRFCAFLLTMMLLAVPVFAEDVDLAAMTLEELQSLSLRLAEEIESRFPSESSPFGSGLYVGGKSIKPGLYIFTCTEIHTYRDYGTVATWDSEEIYDGTSATSSMYIRTYPGQVITLNINDGTVLGIESISGILQPASAFWVP